MPAIHDAPLLVSQLAQRISRHEVARAMSVGEEDIKAWESGAVPLSESDLQKLLVVSNKYGFFDLLPAHSIPPVSYDISAPFNLAAPPIGDEDDFQHAVLVQRPTKIAGLPVDFPLALPASVLTANSKWVAFYARRGFDILTYKTVRTVYRKEHPLPNWVFIRDAHVTPNSNESVVGGVGYWPDDPNSASMANSFGVPSFTPDWWREDVRQARASLRDGHQILVVSIIASVNDSEQNIITDFCAAAEMARDAGAQIIEANYSCPNVPDDPVGEIFQDVERSARISAALSEALGTTPLILKIGYLPEEELRSFIAANARHVDGISAINTVSAKVVDDAGHMTFPGRARAGVSGLAIRQAAHEVARNLVRLRTEFLGKNKVPLTLLGIGGVLTREDCFQYLDDIGVDAVGSCTGAYLNPLLGIDVRTDCEQPSAEEVATVHRLLERYRSLPFLEIGAVTAVGDHRLQRIIDDLEHRGVVNVSNRGNLGEELVTLRQQRKSLLASVG